VELGQANNLRAVNATSPVLAQYRQERGLDEVIASHTQILPTGDQLNSFVRLENLTVTVLLTKFGEAPPIQDYDW
jgi:hypothetical protein